MDVTGTLDLTLPILQMEELREVTWPGFIFINNQKNSSIYWKSLIFDIKSPSPRTAPPKKNCFSCLLWSKTCAARDSSSFPAHKIHVGVWTDISTRYFPDDPICFFSINTHINKPFWRERPISWVYISAGNYPFISYIYGLNQLWVTEFILAFLNPQMQLS